MKHTEFILVSFLIFACYPQKRPADISPAGDVADIKMKDNRVFRAELITVLDSNLYVAELITVPDSNLYVMERNRIFAIRLADIARIEIPGYSVDEGQKIGAALPSLLMQSFILLVASDIGEQTWVYIAGGSMVLTVVLYATSGTEGSFSTPLLKEDVEQLRLYCRYPQVLDDRVWQHIIEKYGYNNETVDKRKEVEKIQK